MKLNIRTGLMNISLAGIFICMFLAACQKDWPEPFTKPSNPWTKDGYTLKSSLNTDDDTLTGYIGVAATFGVVDGDGNPVANVTFIFGDGSSLTGEQVIHSYLLTGVFSLAAVIPGGPTLAGWIRILPFGETDSTEVVISIYHDYDGNLCHDTIGLMVEHISGYLDPGQYFVSGDFNGWPAPINALILSARVIGGHTYAVWAIEHALGVEKFNFGKNFDAGGSAWNYSPNSVYWHETTPPNGDLWVYFNVSGIAPTEQNSTFPGLWGDEDSETWIYRGDCQYGQTTAAVNIYANKDSFLLEPDNPQFYYSLDGGGSWDNYPLSDQGNYYWHQIDGVTYGTVIYFYCLAQAGNSYSKVLGGVMYNPSTDCELVQINKPIQSGLAAKLAAVSFPKMDFAP